MITSQIGKLIKIKQTVGILPYPVERGPEQAAHRVGLMKSLLEEVDQRKHSPRKKSLSPRHLERGGTEENPFSLLKKGAEDGLTTNLSAVELLSLHEDNYEDPKLYFGDDAKEEFWDLYKSERRFKDYNTGATEEIKDPRFAYL